MNKGHVDVDGSHSLIVPSLILLSAIMVEIDSRPRIVSAPIWNRARVIVLAGLAVATMTSLSVGDPSRGSSTWLHAVDTARADCLRRSLDTTQVLIAPFVTYMQVPCSKLIGRRHPQSLRGCARPAKRCLAVGDKVAQCAGGR